MCSNFCHVLKVISQTIVNILYIALTALAAYILAGCSDDNTSGLRLDGETRIEAITVSGYEGVVEHNSRSIEVNLPTGTDLSDLTVDAITLSPGATCDYPAGTHFNASVPRAIRVTNGDVHTEYTLRAAHDNVEFLSFTLDNKYSGTIDNEARTILIFVPLDADVNAMQASFTVTGGADVDPESGSVLDFTAPVVFTATLRTATVRYTVTVIKDEMSQAPKAFIGNAATVDALGDEARTACRWMLDNVPASRYVSLQQIIDGTVRLDDFTMIWCHFDWLDWPGQMWDSRDLFNSY